MAAFAVLFGQGPGVGFGGLQPQVSGTPENLHIQPVFCPEEIFQFANGHFRLDSQLAFIVDLPDFADGKLRIQLSLRGGWFALLVLALVKAQPQIGKELPKFLLNVFDLFVVGKTPSY